MRAVESAGIRGEGLIFANAFIMLPPPSLYLSLSRVFNWIRERKG